MASLCGSGNAPPALLKIESPWACLTFECEEDPRVGLAARKRLIHVENPAFNGLIGVLSQLA